jgi:hypothetical protein
VWPVIFIARASAMPQSAGSWRLNYDATPFGDLVFDMGWP